MASGATVKLGVEGISQFKNNLNQAKQAVKTLDTQLSLTEKQFKASGDAESYMLEKTELLKAKLEQQKAILANAEKALQDMTDKGVDKASKAYQDMYRQMLTAKGGLIDTQSEMDSLTASCDEAASGVSEMKSQLDSIGKQVSFKTVTEGIDNLTSQMEKAAKKALQLGKNIIRGSMDAAAYADDLLTRASKYGEDYDAELVQKMDNVAAYIDTDTDAIINAQKRLRKAMGAEGSKETMGAFAALGIDPNNMDWQDAFWKAGEALRTLQDDVAREEYATRLFGRSWDELNPLFDAGRQKYEQMLSEQTVLTNAQVEALGKEDDAMKKMQQQIDLLKNQFFAGLAPAVTEATDALSGLLEQFNIYLQSDDGKQKMKELGDTLTGLIRDFGKIDFGDVVDKVKKGFDWIVEHSGDIIKAIEGIGIAFAGLKLADLGLNIGRVIAGFNGLLNSGKNGNSTHGSGGDAVVTPGGSANVLLDTKVAQAAATAVVLDITTKLLDNNKIFNDTAKTLEEQTKDWVIAQSENGFISSDRVDELTEKNLRMLEIAEAHKNGTLPPANRINLSDWTFDDNMTSDELMAMVKAAEDLTGSSEVQKQSSEDMTAAADQLKGLPAVIDAAIKSGMTGIHIYSDILCKCRMDAVTTGRIIDIKTAQDADTDVFAREAMRYGYHVQAAHYIDAYYKKISSKTPDWYFIVVEKTEPFCVNILKADIGFLDYGFVVRQDLMNKLIKCQKENSFPGYGVNELCLPGWVEV